MTWTKQIPNIPISDIFAGLILSIIVVVGTFPANDWSYSTGIDPPLFWVFNHLFENGLHVGKHIIFPHGPLAFFMYPLTDNILIASLVSWSLKILLVFNTLFLVIDFKRYLRWIVALIFAYCISLLSSFNHLLLANLILLYCNYYQKPVIVFKVLALFLTAFAFYVKAYVAIVSGTFLFSFLAFQLLKEKQFKKTLIDAFVFGCFILGFWLLMHGTPQGIIRFIWGMMHLAQDNSSAAAYYPQNNWFLLSLSLSTLFALFAINRDKKTTFFVALIGFSLFASWKHGMAREDFFHVKGLLIYLVICLFSFLVFIRKKYGINTILVVIVLALFTTNISNSVNYQRPQYKLFSANNFIDFVTDFDELKKRSDNNSYHNSKHNLLSQDMLNSIGQSTVDVYPWDYSIAAVNNLNWKPRVVIQSYAAYTSWLDNQNAAHFSSTSAPDFLVWEKKKITQDFNKNDFNSIDNRYLLNDEPQTLLQLICNYRLFKSDDKFALYKKRESPLVFTSQDIKNEESGWGEWVDIPSSHKKLLRVKLHFDKTTKQKLKSFFYKDEQFWIYLKLQDGSLHKFRIVPKNGEDGIWINPYVYSNAEQFDVEKVMFSASNQKILSENIHLKWETIEFEGSTAITDFFNLKAPSKEVPLFRSLNSFDRADYPGWRKLKSEQISSEAFSSSSSHLLNDTYSSSFKLNLDSIPFGNIRIHSNVWIKATDYRNKKNVWLVMNIKDKEKGIVYKQLTIDDQMLDRNTWNNVSKDLMFNHQQKNCELAIYVWNKSETKMLIDDFSVIINSVED